MKECECLIACGDFIEGYIYRGRCVDVNMFGEDEFKIIEVYPHNSDTYVIMPFEYFKEI